MSEEPRGQSSGPAHERLVSQLAELRAARMVLELRIRELEEQHEFDERRIDALRAERQHHLTAFTETAARTAALRAEVEQHAATVRELESARDRAQERADSLEPERDRLGRELAEQRRAHADLTARYDDLSARYDTLHRTDEELSAERDTLATRVEALTREHADLSRQIDALRGERAELEGHRDQLESRLLELSQQRNSLADQLRSLEESRAVAVREVQDMLGETQRELAEVSRALSQRELEQRALTADLVKTHTILDARSAQLRKIMAARWYRIAQASWRARAGALPLLAGAMLLLAAAGIVALAVTPVPTAARAAGIPVVVLVGAMTIALSFWSEVRRLPAVPRLAEERSFARRLPDAAAAAPMVASEPARPASPSPEAQTAPAVRVRTRLITRLIPAPRHASEPELERERWLAAARLDGLKDLRVAGVLDEMSRACFAPECTLFTDFTMRDWDERLEDFQPHLLFVESAWNGNSGGWQYGVASYPHPDYAGLPFLRELLGWCREREIPTVFWNKEDPVHFERFSEAAVLFDHIFTTDANCIPAYEELGGDHVKAVQALPFAAQPRLHNPIPVVGKRSPEPVFAGTYYRDRHASRQGNLESLLDAARPFGLVIYDRTFGSKSDEFGFPERFAPHIKGRLPYERLIDVYKSHRLFLNVNSVTDSPTMFSRRVFELLACGTAVVSTESVGIEEMFGELVPIVTTLDEATKIIDRLVNDDEFHRSLTAAGSRHVLANHTYRHRLRAIVDTVGLEVPPDADEAVAAVVIAGDTDGLTQAAAELAAQTLLPHEVLLGVPVDCSTAQAVEQLARQLPEDRVRIVHQAPDTATTERIRELARLAATRWVAPVTPSERYEPGHLRHLVDTALFADADVIGFADGPDRDQEHVFVRVVHPWRVLVAHDTAAATGWALEETEMLALFNRGVRLFAAAAPGAEPADAPRAESRGSRPLP
jgi:predicted nuclease with TOPRIM domain/glycosyltransferase involved in cell wall biosynthesis